MYGIALVGIVVCGLVLASGQQTGQQTDGVNDKCNPTFVFNQYYTGNRRTGDRQNCTSPSFLTQGLPRDCTDILNQGNLESGQYVISPQDGGESFQVYCDMSVDGEAWTVFQRREDGSVDFYLNWADYERGFGNVNSEHWLGNEKIHRITAQGHYQLRVNMTDFEGNSAYADYDNFRLGDAGTYFKLIIGAYSGNAGDGLTERHANKPFSTKDKDHDTYDESCAELFKGAWWYTSCHYANLNGQYLEGAHDTYADGVNWQPWKGFNYSLKFAEMKMKISS